MTGSCTKGPKALTASSAFLRWGAQTLRRTGA
jgi:hypothetical protein